MGRKSEHEVGGQTEHVGAQDEGVGGQTERLGMKPMFVLSFLKNDTWTKYVKEDRPS